MTTRLDRLLLLLESGSTPVIRRSAAQQLGEVQRLHPHELNNLLSKVHSYLGSSQWETRIAAGLAVEAITSNVDQWKPCGISSSVSGDYETKTNSLTEGRLQIKHFDVVQVLRRGSCLLGSYGNEYDVEENIGLDDKEKLRKQKELMNKRLGLDVAGNFFHEELIKIEDFVLKEEPSSTKSSQQQSVEELINEQIFPAQSGMSAREKNRAKRKAKQQAKQTMTGYEAEKKNGESSDGESVSKKCKMSNGPSDQLQSDNLVPATDTTADNTLNMDEIEDWPFDQFCELLMHDIFHPSWEKRHGATTGLREVVKLHGKGAGRNTDLPSHLMDLANQLWLEDLAVRLVCVLALDRFGDFVSDEVVAPVRETCAQTLGVTLHHLNMESVKEVLSILSQLLMQREWEVRHGGLLGIKYLLAVRQDLTDLLLPAVLPIICRCLEDPSDDVRAVAADALLPVTDALVQSFPDKVDSIVDTLWKILVDLDDLTSSTNSIMSLLSSILSHPRVNSERSRQMSLVELVPLLWPFLRHNIMSVRRAALRTLSTLLSKSAEQTDWLIPILSDALRHIFQRCLLESEPDLLQDIHQTWNLLLSHSPPAQLIGVAALHFGSWLCLTMQPALVAFDGSQMIEARRSIREHLPCRQHSAVELVGDSRCYIGGAATVNASPTERDVIVVRARRMAAKLLGVLSAYIARISHCQIEGISYSPIEALGNLFVFYFSSKSALQKLCTAYTILEWLLAKGDCSCPIPVKSKLHECLTEVLYYDEVAFVFTRLQAECREFIANLRLQGIKLDPPYTVESVLTLESVTILCSDVYESVKSQIRPNYISLLEERRSSIQAMVSQTTNELQVLTNRVQCSIAGAVISLRDLPDKMNPIVRPLMDALKREENAELQLHAGTSLAQLLPLCADRMPCPVPKIVKNLCTMLCSDPKYTPVVGKELEDNTSIDGASCDKHNGILKLYAQQSPEPTRGRRPYQKRTTNTSTDLSLDGAVPVENEASRQQPLVPRRGAELALTAIAREAGEEFPVKIATLWETMWGPLKQFKEASCSESVSEIDCDNDDTFAQELVNSLQVLQTVIPAIHSSIYSQLVNSFELLISALKNSYTVVRHMSGRCLATMCRVLPCRVMEYYIEHALPWLTQTDSTVKQRQGCIEALALIIEQLSVDIIPFIVLLIVPVLGRMSDHDQSVRLMSTNVFATLIRLLPLEGKKATDLSLVGNALLEKQNEERIFLEQLLDGKKISNFEITIPLNVELRRYQQEGVNWLAFLARYKLHGILCDDMGLGKTLQSLCILAVDYQKREQASKGSEETIIPPSIVICPPTLTGHWLFEVEKLVGGEYLKPLHYVGPPSERLRLQKMIKSFNLVLVSYDVVRNDIDFFSKIKWNYCILDEGQIIKNSKTKISKAVKQLDSDHRLILSGTPIQNNVLELWSLFDFLMPGFLGTEKQFQACFGRPILQSRDAKSSTKEQEAGALAMEGLHRQVLPFLLRRLKEDVLQDLPPKIIQDYYCDLSTLQIQLYEDFAKSQAKKSVSSAIDHEQKEDPGDSSQKQDSGSSQPSMKTMHIFQALQYLRKVCNHPSLVLTPLHPEFAKVMNQLKMDNSSLHDLHHAPKLVALKQLLNDCGIGLCTEATETPVVNQHRVLLFCQLKMMLDIVEQDLLKAHMPSVTYLRLDGSVPAGSRHQIVNRFNNDPSIDVLLLTTQVGGLGLNLTGADTVIFVEHDWNPSKDLQAMDRAHRIGQKKVVNVYRLVTRGTLEEKIMGLQRFKINIANTVINQENNSLASMGTNQLLDLFRVDRMSFSSGKCKSRSDASDTVEPDSAKTSLKAVLEGLDDLWDSKDYEKEYDVGSFLSSLKNCD